MSRSLHSIPLLLLLLLVASLPACDRARSPLPRSPSLAEMVEKGSYVVGEPGTAETLVFDRRPRLGSVQVGGESRTAVIAGDRFSLHTRIPAGARLHLGAIVPGRAEAPLSVRVSVLEDRGPRQIASADLEQSGDRRWVDLVADLSPLAGRPATLLVEAQPAAAEVAWAPGTLTVSHGGGPSSPAPRSLPSGPPNVLLIVVDTLRADHVGCYGYPRRTTPNVDRLLAARGVRASRAWAPAPWTLPSVVGLLSGLDPGRLLGDDPASFGLPEGAPSLAEELARLGYDTAAFVANPTLRRTNGFARGFDTFASIGDGSAAMELHADSLNARAQPWLAAHRDRRFFLYLHYIDPHDPYVSPELKHGFLAPDHAWYRGPVTGRDVHGLFAGRRQLDDPARDLPHLVALYDSEVRTADRAIGEILGTLPGSVMANTLVVFTSDHGEELLDHGGWKHGRTLFEEQLSVPLVLRWDGHLPQGAILRGASSLLDIVPTVLRATGSEPPPGDGTDLVPSILAGEPPSRRPLVAAHHHSGPLRLAVLERGLKMHLFDRSAPFSAKSPLERHFFLDEASRLPRLALFDLAVDPTEKRDLAASRRRPIELLWRAAHDQLDRQLPGLRIVARGLPEGARLRAEVILEPPPRAIAGYFLGDGDVARLGEGELNLQLIGEPAPLHKGVRVLDPVERVSVSRLSVQGADEEPRVTFLGAAGETATIGDRLRRHGWPAPADGPEIWIWLPGDPQQPRAEPAAAGREQVNDALRALGYVQ